ncbi:MAG: sulfotransferase [Opitutales bacterium]
MTPLLIAGLPRSGTTALVRLLNTHPRVGLAMERYKFLARHSRLPAWSDRLFAPDRLFFPDAADTNILPTEDNGWARYYDRLRGRMTDRTLTVVGDKYPFYYEYASGIARRVPGLRMLILLRDIQGIAASYQRRAEDADDRWPARNGYRLAVRHYNTALPIWTEQVSGPLADRMAFLSYERLFQGDTEALDHLLGWLDLGRDPALDRAFRRQPETWQGLETRTSALTSRQTAWIEKKIDRRAEARFFSALHGSPAHILRSSVSAAPPPTPS